MRKSIARHWSELASPAKDALRQIYANGEPYERIAHVSTRARYESWAKRGLVRMTPNERVRLTRRAVQIIAAEKESA